MSVLYNYFGIEPSNLFFKYPTYIWRAMLMNSYFFTNLHVQKSKQLVSEPNMQHNFLFDYLIIRFNKLFLHFLTSKIYEK